MVKRYPHKANLILKSSDSLNQDQHGNIINDSLNQIEIEGRYSPSSVSDKLDYKAKFYCDLGLIPELFKNDGNTIVINGKSFQFTYHPFQKHAELWLT